MKNIRTIIGALLLAAVCISCIVWNRSDKREIEPPPQSATKAVASPIPREKPAMEPAGTSRIEPASVADTPPAKTLNELMRDPEGQRFGIRKGLKNYAKPIKAMKLSPEKEKQLWDLLLKRAEAGYIAQEVHQQRMLEHKPSDSTEVLALARGEVDAEIREAFGEDLSKTIASMVDAGLAFAMLSAYDAAFEQIGEPITPDQSLPVALIFKECYGKPKGPDQIPTIALIDPATGLIPSDSIIIGKLAEALSARQLEAFRKERAHRNIAYANKYRNEQPPLNP